MIAREKRQWSYYWVGKVVEWFVAQRPDFKQNHSIAPHVTGTSVLVVVQRLCIIMNKETLIHCMVLG